MNRPGTPTTTAPVVEPVDRSRPLERPVPDDSAALSAPDADEGDPHRPWDSTGVPPTAHGRPARTVVRTPA